MQGRRYMDFHGNNVHHVGYGHPRLLAAIRRQLDELSFAPRRYTCEPAVELAEKLVEIAPGNLSKVLFAPSGSDAIEMALAYARAATGRFKTISFWDSYHGAGFGAQQRGGRGHVPQRADRPLAGRNRACASVWRLSQRLGRDRRRARSCAQRRSGTSWRKRAMSRP